MNSICFLPNEISDDVLIEFSDSKRLKHLHTHLKSKVNDVLKVTVLGMGIFETRIIKLDNSVVELKIIETLTKKEGWFNLLIGLSRPQTIKKVLEHATTFGAKEFSIHKAQLSEKSYSTSKLYENERYGDFLIDGIAQSKTYYNLPDLNISNYLNLELFKDHKNKYFLSLNSKDTFINHTSKLDDPLIAIGPERGWTKKEEEKLIESGFTPIGISNSCLRVEHACFSAISQIEMLRISSDVH